MIYCPPILFLGGQPPPLPPPRAAATDPMLLLKELMIKSQNQNSDILCAHVLKTLIFLKFQIYIYFIHFSVFYTFLQDKWNKSVSIQYRL